MTTPEDPKRVVAAVFDLSAPSYDEHWAPPLHRHTRELVRMAPWSSLRAGRERLTVLDVATGAGTLLADLRSAAGPGGLVVGADLSAGMLRRGPRDIPRVQ